MRITNEQIDAIRICHSQLQCSDCKYDKTLDDCDPAKLQLAADLLEAREFIKEMRTALKDLVGRMDVEGEDALASFNKAESILDKSKEYVG